MGVSAVNTANNLIYLTVSALLAFMGISGFFGKANISNLKVITTIPAEVFAGTPVPLKITLVNNRAILPAFLIRVNVAGREVHFPFVNRLSRESKHVDVTFSRRGEHVINDIHVSSVFPFNFFVRFNRKFQAIRLTVFPLLVRGEIPGLYQDPRHDHGELPVDRSGFESDMISIRQYAAGDPLKYINWKATAKTGELKTRELSVLSRRPVIIDFDGLRTGDMEEKISRVAYILLKLIKENVSVGLKLKGRLYGPDLSRAHRLEMLTGLALYPRVPSPAPPHGVPQPVNR